MSKLSLFRVDTRKNLVKINCKVYSVFKLVEEVWVMFRKKLTNS